MSWINFTRIRARAIGDCGVTQNANGEWGSFDSEKITTIIQKVKQDQETLTKRHANLTQGILYTGEDLKGLGIPNFTGTVTKTTEIY